MKFTLNRYYIRVLNNPSNNRVDIRLSAYRDKWEADMLRRLADLMKRYEILKLHLPMGYTYFEVSHFPLEDLRGILSALLRIGFSIKCPLFSK